MTTPIRHFRKRNIVERRVLQIVRGKSLREILAFRGIDSTVGGAADARDDLCFWHLRESSYRCGLEIMPVDAQYLATSELYLLRWLAESQRLAGPRSVHVADRGFIKILMKAAQVLKDVNIILPYTTLSIPIYHGDMSMQ